jgi:hypothetical protein
VVRKTLPGLLHTTAMVYGLACREDLTFPRPRVTLRMACGVPAAHGSHGAHSATSRLHITHSVTSRGPISCPPRWTEQDTVKTPSACIEKGADYSLDWALSEHCLLILRFLWPKPKLPRRSEEPGKGSTRQYDECERYSQPSSQDAIPRPRHPWRILPSCFTQQ